MCPLKARARKNDGQIPPTRDGINQAADLSPPLSKPGRARRKGGLQGGGEQEGGPHPQTDRAQENHKGTGNAIGSTTTSEKVHGVTAGNVSINNNDYLTSIATTKEGGPGGRKEASAVEQRRGNSPEVLDEWSRKIKRSGTHGWVS